MQTFGAELVGNQRTLPPTVKQHLASGDRAVEAADPRGTPTGSAVSGGEPGGAGGQSQLVGAVVGGRTVRPPRCCCRPAHGRRARCDPRAPGAARVGDINANVAGFAAGDSSCSSFF